MHVVAVLVNVYCHKISIVMYKLTGISLVLLIFMILSCSRVTDRTDNYPINIKIDYDNSSTLNIEDFDIVWLETTDSALLGEIYLFDNMGDTIVVASGNVFASFDRSGKFLHRYGCLGQGPGEYLSVMSMWTDGDTVVLYDMDKNCQLKYDKDGQFIKSLSYIKPETKSFIPSSRVVEPIPDGSGYLTVNTYYGGEPWAETVSLLDTAFRFVRTVPGRKVLESWYTYNCTSRDKENNRILYWEVFRDTVFSVTPAAIKPLYVFDFGKYSIPADVSAKEQSDRRQAFVSEASPHWVSGLMSFNYHNSKLYFTYNDNKQSTGGLIVYDEKSGEAKVYKFLSEIGRYKRNYFFKIIEDTLVSVVTDDESIESNPGLMYIPLTKIN